ncbi:hypothetical protein DFR70_103653 [Nocardia tenerifensis]|uniref:Uncharacterized protein n=1 Tax=Nocardia tenerifensis TaxID=228006 RepID=A0A318K8R7_9NOCA|nr:hypothetical protein [Nocardia tenerifensis]PXX66898.1 hypothetical protein DFR70_103653 [Nocardia tenerifensis]
MAEYYKGRRISTREEDGLPPLTEEEIAETLATVAEFNARRNAVPPEKRIHLSSRFGDDDFNDEDVPRNPDGSRKDRNPTQEGD